MDVADGYLDLTVYSTLANSVDELKTWIATQHLLGTPVTVQYQLAEPIVIELDYNAIKQFYPYTHLSTNAEVQPTLEVKFRVLGG